MRSCTKIGHRVCLQRDEAEAASVLCKSERSDHGTTKTVAAQLEGSTATLKKAGGAVATFAFTASGRLSYKPNSLSVPSHPTNTDRHDGKMEVSHPHGAATHVRLPQSKSKQHHSSSIIQGKNGCNGSSNMCPSSLVTHTLPTQPLPAGSDDDDDEEMKEDAEGRLPAAAAGTPTHAMPTHRVRAASMHDIPLQDSHLPPAQQQHAPQPPPMAYHGKTVAIAAATGDLPTVVLLWSLATTQGQNPALPDEKGDTPLHHAALAPTPDVAAFVMQQTGGAVGGPGGLPMVRNADGETPLLRAATAGHLATLKYLIEQGSDVTVTDTINGSTIFHNACRNDQLWALVYLVHAATQAVGSKEEVTRLLLLPDLEDHTCLDWACFGGYVPTVHFLLRRLGGGAAARRVDGKGRTGLHLAARMRQVEMCRYLVGAVGLDPSLKDAEGKDVWAYAEKDMKLLEALQVKKRSKAEGEVDNTPTRANPVRLSFLVSYATITAIVWTAPFFLAWYFLLPALVLLSIFYRRNAAVSRATHHKQQQVSSSSATTAKPSSRSTWLSEWFVAHERYVGLWVGTILAFAATLPILHLWPSSTAWSSQAEAVGTSSSESSLLASASFSVATMVAMYVCLTLMGVVWMDLVFGRPDPGVVAFNEEKYDEMMTEVGVRGAPPSVTVACPTCMIRKPIRSKHCRECGYCVARMDHHCVWLDGCVGLQNHGRFVLFLVFHILSVLLYLVCVLPFLWRAVAAALPMHVHDASQVLRVFVLRPILPLFLQSLFGLGTTCSLLALLLEQVRNVCGNWTSNDRINGTRYAYITISPSTGRTKNLFDKGMWANVREFVGWEGGREEEGGWQKKEKIDYRNLYDLSEVTAAAARRGGRGGRGGGCCEEGNGRYGGHVHGGQGRRGGEEEGGVRCEGDAKNDAVAALSELGAATAAGGDEAV